MSADRRARDGGGAAQLCPGVQGEACQAGVHADPGGAGAGAAVLHCTVLYCTVLHCTAL